jgi:hypothetical protein
MNRPKKIEVGKGELGDALTQFLKKGVEERAHGQGQFSGTGIRWNHKTLLFYGRRMWSACLTLTAASSRQKMIQIIRIHFLSKNPQEEITIPTTKGQNIQISANSQDRSCYLPKTGLVKQMFLLEIMHVYVVLN